VFFDKVILKWTHWDQYLSVFLC